MNHITWKFAARSFSLYKYFLLRISFWPPKIQSHPRSFLSLCIASCTKNILIVSTVVYYNGTHFCIYWIIGFFQKAKFHFYCSRELSVFGIEKDSYINRIDSFLFVYIKTFRKTIDFCILIKTTITTISEIQRARFIYTKGKKNCKTNLYTKI